MKAFSLCLAALAVALAFPALGSAQDEPVEPTPFPYGLYPGTVLRMQTDGQRQDTRILLQTYGDGYIFGSMDIIVPSYSSIRPLFRGRVDLNGRGYIKLQFTDPKTGLFIRNLGTEKIPVFFSRDGGVVVGVSIDSQGTALTFRAVHQPMGEPGEPVPPPNG